MATVGNHQQGAFSSPINGQAADATVVLANDNATRTTANAHDADATIHIQSSVLASRPAAGTAQRVWITTDGLRAYVDSGSVWGELAYLPTAGGTVTGAVTMSAAVTMASTLAVALPVTIGSTGSGTAGQVGYKDDGGTARWAAGIVGSAGERKWSVYDSVNAAYRLSVNETTGVVTIATGLTVSSGGVTVNGGLTSVQNLTTASTLTVSAGGAAITGPTAVTGSLSVSSGLTVTTGAAIISAGGLTVSASGAAITGDSTVTGKLTVTAHGVYGAWDGSGGVDGKLRVSNDTASTASAGVNSLPASPVGFLLWKLGATTIKVPYYAS